MEMREPTENLSNQIFYLQLFNKTDIQTDRDTCVLIADVSLGSITLAVILWPCCRSGPGVNNHFVLFLTFTLLVCFWNVHSITSCFFFHVAMDWYRFWIFGLGNKIVFTVTVSAYICFLFEIKILLVFVVCYMKIFEEACLPPFCAHTLMIM